MGLKAEPETVAKIATTLGLTRHESEWDVGIGREFGWWKKSDVQDLTPYWKSNPQNNYFRYLWYKEDTQQVYYLGFGV